MNNLKFAFLLFCLSFFSLSCYSTEYGNVKNTRMYWQGSDPSSVAAKANQMPSSVQGGGLFSQMFQDPMMNSVMNGYSNMIQGEYGGNSYSAVEMQRQQMDYTRQNTQDGDE